MISLRGALTKIVLAIVVSGCSRQSADTFDLPETARKGTIENIISIEFPKKPYRFSLAKIANGVTIDYTIRVKQDIDNVIPRPQDDGAAAGPGPSGLFPFEIISGNGQSYSLRDIGLGPPNEKPARTIKNGVYSASFEWDGRNWNGPSDFDPPKGDPFPPGSYTLTVSIVGEVRTEEGKKPYDISNNIEVILVP
ncbi:hypothetical protein Pan161_20530 [Gimesia algae]|uniref:Uncharacterized protein n=2 Tax=Gimesia algae TaxID=2527971 RepID=A0A517VBL8_9PLAN|nr:hypothetical protein Pan161_20530 [Gimesia algae]